MTRLVSLLAAVALVATLSPNVAAPAAASSSALERVSGPDRFSTAAELARRSAGSAQPARVWIATGANYPDALAAAALGEPIVLVTRDGVPQSSADALARMNPAHVIAVGGAAAISAATLEDAARHGQAQPGRVSGSDRYATSAEVARMTRSSADIVWIATGAAFPDALAAGPVAAQDEAPLLLVAGDELHADVQREIERLAPSEIVVAGGPSAVSQRVADAAARAAGSAEITRLAGPSRFDTAAVIAQRGRDRHRLGDTAFVATGMNFPDALAAGPAAHHAGAPLLLATQRELPAPTNGILRTLEPERVVVVGGEAALSLTVAQRAADPTATGVCDAYDATRDRVIQGHPENLQAHLDAWSGPWTIDTFRNGWSMAVPSRWRYDQVNSFEHGGVLFYVDTEEGYSHWLRVTVFCGNPFLVAGGRALDPDDPGMIRDHGPHTGLGRPTEEDTAGPAIYSATYHRSADHVIRFDYVAVDDDVLLVHYDATNRFARNWRTRTAGIADQVAASVGRAGQVGCPPSASACAPR